MSLFLGPIHHWMWNKIQFQDELNKYLINKNKSILKDAINQYELLSNTPLEYQINTDNIHGWLQEKVNLVESSYAGAVNRLLENNMAAMPTLMGDVKEFSRDIGLTKVNTPNEAYSEIFNLLLDGMPCDHVNEIVEDKEDTLIWKRNICVHGKFWEDGFADAETYYQLRTAIFEGLLEKSEYSVSVLDNNMYKIERKM